MSNRVREQGLTEFQKLLISAKTPQQQWANYLDLQTKRQCNIREALQRDDIPTDGLVELYKVALRGFELAFACGINEGDSVTFMNLQGNIINRLHQRPTQEVLAAAALMQADAQPELSDSLQTL